MMLCNTDIVRSLSEGASNDGDVPLGVTLDDAPRILGAMTTRLRGRERN
jgi:hypothetical protein